MEEMYQAALNLLRIVEHYDTDGTPAEQAMASNIISEHRLPWLVMPKLHAATGRT
jgi:hypothetical protein